jgi:hypothetical protein
MRPIPASHREALRRIEAADAVAGALCLVAAGLFWFADCPNMAGISLAGFAGLVCVGITLDTYIDPPERP